MLSLIVSFSELTLPNVVQYSECGKPGFSISIMLGSYFSNFFKNCSTNKNEDIFISAFTLPICLIHLETPRLNGIKVAFLATCTIGFFSIFLKFGQHLRLIEDYDLKNTYSNSVEIIFLWICCLSIGNGCIFTHSSDKDK